MEILGGIFIAFLVLIFTIIFLVEVFIFLKNKKDELNFKKEREEAKYQIYEIEILNKLNDRAGYSFDAEDIMEAIVDFLPDFIDYKTVSYALFLPEKIVLNHFLKNSVSKEFIADVKKKILELAPKLNVEEKMRGAILDEEAGEPMGSFFSILLQISGKIVGVLAVADTRKNFYKEKEISTLRKISETATKAVAKLQQAVESENSKLNAMVASMTDGVLMVDKENRILVANPAAKNAVGIKNDFSLQDFSKALEKYFNLVDKIDESFRLEKIFISEEILLQDKFFKIVVAPVQDNWKKLGCVIIFRDITKEKEVEKMKEDFTSMIVHELRSPLDAIKKMTEMMRTSDVKKEKRADCFQMIYSNSSDMLELITNLLDIAKIEAGKFELLKQNSSIAKIIESRILFFDIAAKDAKVKLTSIVAKDIPAEAEFDPRTISQVLNNLISNALKFTKENGSITIQVLLHKNGENLQKEAGKNGIKWFLKNNFSELPDSIFVAVTDTGIGIAPDQIEKLFNKFSQAKTTFVQKGGTGLGLAITKSIVESHGGIAGVESVLGKGSTFYFTLPVIS